MKPFVKKITPVSNAVLNLVAHLPTQSLPAVIDEGFFAKLEDKDFMRIAVLLAQRAADEGGRPTGAVIVDAERRQIVGKGYDTSVQGDDPCGHGVMAAVRDAGRRDFSGAALFTSLGPCDVCASVVLTCGFARVAVGDATHAAGNETKLKEKGVEVDLLKDPMGVALYKAFLDDRG